MANENRPDLWLAGLKRKISFQVFYTSLWMHLTGPN